MRELKVRGQIWGVCWSTFWSRREKLDERSSYGRNRGPKIRVWLEMLSVHIQPYYWYSPAKNLTWGTLLWWPCYSSLCFLDLWHRLQNVSFYDDPNCLLNRPMEICSYDDSKRVCFVSRDIVIIVFGFNLDVRHYKLCGFCLYRTL